MNSVVIPNGAKDIIAALSSAGFEAYVVGGCVRDSLLGLEPHDWDICTSAVPQEVVSCFPGKRIVCTGLKHGTVTLLMDDGGYEITTFRIDGEYSDHRHPDDVTFTPSLREDLARRDFTMNAMAYNDSVGLVDPFNGQRSLQNHEISCVGNPENRFEEDALRVMRALRFASTYGFHINFETEAAIRKYASKLCNISAERINAELCRLLLGKGVLQILLDYSDVITEIIPELKPCVGFEQNNPYHQYTVYDHIAHAVSNYTGDDISIKVALLLHDIGKPQCYSEDERGGHFYCHGVPSRDIAETVMKRLRFDNKTRHEVLDLVLYHDSVIDPTPKVVRRWLNKIGKDRFLQLLDVRMADIQAHATGTQESRIKRCLELRKLTNEIAEQEQCFSLKNLQISGRDIIQLGGTQGPVIGEILERLLCETMDDRIENKHDILMKRAQELVIENT